MFILLLIGFKEALLLCVTVIIITLLFNKYCTGKIGGITGDILGANNELVEIVGMLVLIGFQASQF
jgi:adenosylcobinamide-GDP ribazoletransferase